MKKIKSFTAQAVVLVCLLAPKLVSAQNCSVNSGIPTTQCLGSTIKLEGGITGSINSNSVRWSIISSPVGGSITIANPSQLYTTTSPATVAGSYVFRISLTCQDGVSVSQDVTHIINSSVTMPSITPSSIPACISGGTTINLGGNSPVAGETQSWTFSSSVFLGSFDNNTSGTPVFTFASVDVYKCATSGSITFTRTYTNTTTGCTNSVSQTYNPVVSNNVVDARVSLCGGINLDGTCPGNGTSAWSVVSTSPVTTVNFGSPTASFTSITNPVNGVTYTIRYTVSGTSCVNGSKDITFTYNSSPLLPGTVAIAGPDQKFTNAIPGTIVLNGNTPNALNGETGLWTQILGQPVTITSPTSAVTTVTGMPSTGTFSFLWTIIKSGDCSTSDDVYIKGPVSLTVTPSSNSCGTGLSGITLTPASIFSYGNFSYREVDSVNIKLTLLGGPSDLGTVKTPINFRLFGGVSCPSAGCDQGVDSIAVGSFYNFRGIPSNNISNATGNLYGAYRYTVRFYPKQLGEYTFRYEVSVNGGPITSSNITIVYSRSFGANAGTDQVLACGINATSLVGSDMFWANTSNPSSNLTYAPLYQGEWSTISKPAGATDPISGANKYLKTPALTGLIPGKYTFRLKPRGGDIQGCGEEDLVDVYVASSIPAVISMPANSTVCNSGSVKLSVPQTGYYPKGWGLVSGPSSVSFVPADTSRNVTITGLVAGTYVFSWTDSSRCGNTSNTTSVTISPTPLTQAKVSPSCSPVGSGAAVTITANKPDYAAGETATLVQYIGGVPVAWGASNAKSIISTSSTATDTTWEIEYFVPSTSVSSGLVAIYTINRPGCGSTSDTFAVMHNGSFPQTLSLSSNNVCNATFPITLKPIPTSVVPLSGNVSGNYEWLRFYNDQWSVISKPSGAADPVFVTQGDPTTDVIFSAPGEYLLQITLSDLNPETMSCLGLTKNTFSIPVRIGSATSVSTFAGNDQENCYPNNSFAVSASPSSGLWSINSFTGATPPIIANTASNNTTVTFPAGSKASLQWTPVPSALATWCAGTVYDIVNLAYTDTAIIYGAKEITVCEGSSYGFLFNAPPSGVSASFTQLSGPGASTILIASAESALITNLMAGTYTFQYSFTSPGCGTNTEEVQLNIGNCLSISGHVWNDANGDAVRNGTEAKFNLDNSLKAYLTDVNNKVVDLVHVDAAGYYAFNEIASGLGYKVVIALSNSSNIGANLSHGVLLNTFVNTGTNIVGVSSTTNINGLINFGTVTTTLSDRDFGIEEIPNSDPKSQFIPYPEGGVIPPSTATNAVSGTDMEDGILGNPNSFMIKVLPLNATMYYNGAQATAGQEISNFNPALLSYNNISNGSSAVVFDYAFLDAAQRQDPSPATYTLFWGIALPINLTSFSGFVQNCEAKINWQTATEDKFGAFELQRSIDGGATFISIAKIKSKGSNSTYDYIDKNAKKGNNIYRLKLINVNGSIQYSKLLQLQIACHAKPSIILSPMPIQNTLNITGLKGNEKILILNATGQLITEQSSGANQVQIDLSKFTSGLYEVFINNGVSRLLQAKVVKI